MSEAVDRAFAPALAAVAEGRVPGAAIGIVTADGLRVSRVAGKASLEPEAEPLTEAHWFDLASVSKVIATTTMILTLAERRLTFRDCLAHRTFLPAVEPIYTYGGDPDRLRAFVLQREWRQGEPCYSDINFILLGIAIERITGQTLADWPLPPGLAFGPPPGPAVATEACSWRGRVMKGEVHDENAWALGGAAGHAGLFGTIDGVMNYALGLIGGDSSPFLIEAIRTPVHLDRTCGWERRFAGWHGGDACSAETIGHTGFTGTGLWVDFDRGLAWTLLTNRVHPTRHRDTGILELRRATGDAVIEAFS